ncbi:MAG: nuclease A inhibitor family protein [Spirosomataceae bacterium]
MEENINFENTSSPVPVPTDLKTDLEAATQGLYFLSESDEPFEYVEITSQGGQDDVVSLLKVQLCIPEKALIETVEYDEFMGPLYEVLDWYGDDEKIMARHYQTLDNLLKSRLVNLQVIRVGEGQVAIYVLGQDAATCQWLGVKTTSIET